MYVVINGGGKIAQALALNLLDDGHDIAIIERHTDTAEKILMATDNQALVIVGDGTDKKYQDDAGSSRADVFVATTGTDEDNLISCQLARVVFEVPRLISRVSDPSNQSIFAQFGIEAICSTLIISRMISEEVSLRELLA